MPFTGETVYGWRIACMTNGRRATDGTMRWLDEWTVELVKGQRHIRATGQHGIDPQIVLNRAITAGLRDDLREAKVCNREPVEVMAIAIDLDQHERKREVYENGFLARHSTGTAAVLKAGPAGAKG